MSARVRKVLGGALVVGVALLVSGRGGAPQPIGVSGSWRLILDDEFDGSSLAGSHFETGWRSGSASNVGITQGVNPGEVDCDDPRQVTVAHGELDLTLIAKKETCGGRTHRYASGIVTTDHTFSYTYG